MLPNSTFLLGMVTSIFSLVNFLSSSKSLKCFSPSLILFSNSSLTSFTKLPINGLSSGLKAPMPLKIKVSSPFFPRYFILTSSSSFASFAFVISLRAFCFICAICSFIIFFVSSLLVNLDF